MTRIRVAGLVAAVLTIGLVAPVAADTIGEPNGDQLVAAASFEFVAGNGQTYFASSDVIEDHLTETVTISASYFTSTAVTCPGEDPADQSDDFEGQLETSFFADGPATSATFGSKLSSAVASGSVTGDVTQFDPCTGEQSVVGQDTIDVVIDLLAAGPSTSSRSRDISQDEEGNLVVFVFRSTERTATGSVTFDGDPHSVDGVILSRWWRTFVGEG
jgi:hypothetical protein